MVGAAPVMAKKKSKPSKPAAAREDFIRVRLSAEFKAWLQRYADFRNLSMSDTVIQALIRDAKTEEFGEGAPKR